MALYLTLGITALTLILASYLHSWYRLRHFPGPSLASFSYLWLAKVSLSGRAGYIHMSTRARYPQANLIRIAPDLLITDDPSIIRHMNSARSPYRRDTWYHSFRVDPKSHNMFSTTDETLHSHLKARTAPAYSGKEIPSLESDIDEEIMSLKLLIREKYLARPMDLGKTAQYFTLDAITKIAFGKAWGFLKKDGDVRGFMQTLEDVAAFILVCSDVPWLRSVVFSDAFLWLAGPSEKDERGMGRLIGVSKETVEERFASKDIDRPDMLGSFLRHGLTRKQCEAEIPIVVSAGSDTVASAIRGTLLYIMTAPNIYRQLQKEIDGAVADGKISGDIISTAEAKSLPYLQAVIWEGLRLNTVNHVLASKLVPPEGDVIDGMHIPGGTKIGWNAWSLLRREEMFGHDAAVFRPERWLEISPDKRTAMERHVDLTFGYGRYMCAGKAIAMMELNKIFFEFPRDFDLQIVDPKMPWDMQQYSVSIVRDMWAKISPRGNAPNQVEAEGDK